MEREIYVKSTVAATLIWKRIAIGNFCQFDAASIKSDRILLIDFHFGYPADYRKLNFATN